LSAASTLRAVLFDLDGTLVDSLADIAGAANLVLAELGHATHPVESYRVFVGEGVTRLLEQALPAAALGDLPAAEAQFRRVYPQRMLDETRPYEGIPELLEALAARQIPCAVLTNKPQLAAEGVVEHLFAPGTFVAVVGQRDDQPRKPDPTGALDLARRLGLAPSRLAMVGDTRTDMETARNAGLRAVGVRWGFRDEAELRAHGADVVLSQPADLLTRL
jgi:phosphoglycolate phosphatase